MTSIYVVKLQSQKSTRTHKKTTYLIGNEDGRRVSVNRALRSEDMILCGRDWTFGWSILNKKLFSGRSMTADMNALFLLRNVKEHLFFNHSRTIRK